MTHEESIVHLVRHDLRSYRQLPVLLYQLQTKFRDEPRPRAGLIRTREFTMKDAYSFHATPECLDATYNALHEAYERIFTRCGLDYVVVESDPGMMGGKTAHEFIAFSENGEDTIILCARCGYSANRQVARFQRDVEETAEPLPLEEVATPGKTTIEDVAGFLGIAPSRTAKAVFFHGEKRGLIFAVLRGDYEINETLLMKAVGETELRPARPEEIATAGAVAGYASPVGVKNAFVVVDESVAAARNLVSGANREGYHLRNVNIGRDFTPNLTAEIAAADADRACVQCGSPLAARRGIEVGNIFKLGTRYSAAMHALFQDQSGEEKPFIMGCYGIGSGRLMASVAEQSHDKDGLIWPEAIAPFDCVVVLANRNGREALVEIERQLSAAHCEALLDDRDLRAGVIFKDADLIGIPRRLTVGRKIAEGIVELRDRKTGTTEEIRIEEIAAALARPGAVRPPRE
jgi:prolyl-tRNA synthetase